MELYLSLLLIIFSTSKALELVVSPYRLQANHNIQPITNRYLALFPKVDDCGQAQALLEEQFNKLNQKIHILERVTNLICVVAFHSELKVDLKSVVSDVKIFQSFDLALPPLHQPRTSDIRSLLPHGYTGVAAVHDTLGYRGEEIKVGIIDTGVDYSHPALGGCLGPNCKVILGHDYTKEGVQDQCHGHGTHVAGIIAANTSSFIGVAPMAKLGIYRVLDCKGEGSDMAIIQAMEQSLYDGMDIINLSLGSEFSWPDHPLAVAASKLTQHGIIVIAAAGNSGENGLFTIGTPSVGKDVISVASLDNHQLLARSFTIVGKDTQSKRRLHFYPSVYNTKIARGGYEITTIDMPPPLDKICTINKTRIQSSIFLVPLHECDNHLSLLQSAGSAKAISAFIFGKNRKSITLTDSKYENTTLHGISNEDGMFLYKKLRQEISSVKIMVLDELTVTAHPNKKLISVYSAVGPDYEFNIKPDITAPGGAILSTWPMNKGRYATISGTSMASPYLSGVAALVKQAHRSITPTQLRLMLQNTATSISTPGDLGPKFSVLFQGAGLVNAYRAITTKIHINPRVLTLKDTIHQQTFSSLVKAKRIRLQVENLDNQSHCFNFTHLPAQTIIGFDDASQLMSNLEEYKSYATITTSNLTCVQPNQKSGFNIMIEEPSISKYDNMPKYPIYSGFVQLNSIEGNHSLSVPYMGIMGDMRKIPIFSKSTTVQYFGKPTPGGNETLEMRLDEMTSYPVLYIVLNYGTSHLKVTLRQGSSIIGVLFELKQRLLARENIKLGPWDGLVQSQNDSTAVKPGLYQLQIAALNLFGDLRNEHDYQIWPSVSLKILDKQSP